jgi:hypothetical protein
VGAQPAGRNGGKMISIRFNSDLKGTSLEHKLSMLIEETHKQIARIERGENSELLEVVYLFYLSSIKESTGMSNGSNEYSAYLEVWRLYYPEGKGATTRRRLRPRGCSTFGRAVHRQALSRALPPRA